jgi:hypothetical protein
MNAGPAMSRNSNKTEIKTNNIIADAFKMKIS